MKLIYTVMFFSFFGFKMFAQCVIKGEIKDLEKRPLGYANVYLKTETGSVVDYSYADEYGNYELKTYKTGKLYINFSALNYQTVVREIELSSGQKILNISPLLNHKPVELDEVTLHSQRQITQKKDTIIFNAKSFATGNEKVVEDLLRKIPGLTVTSEGVIKVGNQEVEKVMIDGDDFFEKGYKLLTKNMPSRTVEKVEIYEHYSNNKYLKNVEHSDKVALNLKINDKIKREWFGDVELGYGLISENPHEIHGNIMNFGKKNKYYLITNINNTGLDATGDIEHLIRPKHDANEPSSIGDNQNARSFIEMNQTKPDLKAQRVNFNNDKMLSLNSIFSISEKIKMKTIFFLNTAKNEFFSNGTESFRIQNINFQNTENQYQKKSKVTGFGKIDLTYDFSSTKMLQYFGKFNFSNEKNNHDMYFNNEFLNEKLIDKNGLSDHKMVFSNKIKKGKVLLFTSRFIEEEVRQNYKMQPFLYEELFLMSADKNMQNIDTRLRFFGIESHLMNRLDNQNLIEFQAGSSFRKDNLVSDFLLKKNNTEVVIPLDYQNRFTYKTNNLFFKFKYRYSIKDISILAQADTRQFFNEITDFEMSKKQTPFFINPKLSIDWNSDTSNKISATYTLSKTNVSIVDNFTNNINTGFRSFQKGTGEFNQLQASSFSLNHNYGNWSKRFFVNTYITYVRDHDFISTNSYVFENFSTSEKILIHDKNSLSISSKIEKYIKPLRSNFKFNIEASKSDFKNSVNNSGLREVENTQIDYEVECRSGFRGFFNYHLGFKSGQNKIETATTNSYKNNVSFLDLYFTIAKNLGLQIQTERYHFGSMDDRENNYYFADFIATYTLKKKNIVFSLIGNNLTNTKIFTDYRITDVSISKTEYRIQPRYLLLKMEFRF